MKEIFYENCILRNTNYYLLCTLYHLEKQKIEHLNNCIKETDLQNELSITEDIVVVSENKNNELIDLLKKKENEFVLLKTELHNLKIEMEIQKEFSTHKINNLESVKQKLEDEMTKIQQKQDSETDEIDDPEIAKKEIEKLKRENVMLTINNQQLQFELIRSIKLRE